MLHSKSRRRAGRASLVRRAAGAIAIAAIAAGPANAATCIKASETRAIETRVLHTRLMVAALSCDAADAYNRFVTRHQGDLHRNGEQVIGLFKRAYGKGYMPRLDRYVTALANEASMISMADRYAFCARSTAVMDELGSANAGALDAAAARYTDLVGTAVHGAGAFCQASRS